MKKVLPFLVLLLVLGIAAAVFLSKIKEVQCSSKNMMSCPAHISESLKALEKTPLWKATRSVNEDLSRYPEVASFTTQVSPLGNVSVNLILRDPVIALKPEGSDTATLYTANGVPAGQSKDTSLPIINVHEQVPAENLPFVATLSYELTKVLPVKRITLTTGALEVVDSQDRRLLYPLSGDIDELLGATVVTFSQLNDASEKFNINGKAIVVHEVDFRFKNPVLRE